MQPHSPTIQQALQQAYNKLCAHSESATLDAEILLALVLNKARSHLYAWPDKQLTDNQRQAFNTLIKRREKGEPIAYITGRREFWSLEIEVNPGTLIPRPDTETLVEWVLNHFPATPLKIADLGTGSGAIALALASERPGWQILASDHSEAALSLARLNAQRLSISNVSFTASNWLESIKQYDFDLIVSNPPYIREADPHLQQGDVRFEPHSALTAGPSGLDDIERIIQQACKYLKPQGWLALEHGYEQAEAVAKLLKLHNYQSIRVIKDLGNRDRISVAQVR